MTNTVVKMTDEEFDEIYEKLFEEEPSSIYTGECEEDIAAEEENSPAKPTEESNPELPEENNPTNPPVKITWETKRLSAKTVLDMYRQHKIVIPKCQRLYVWTETQRKELLETIRIGAPFGDITLGEVGGQNYLGDGYQRMTTMLMLADDPNLTKEEHKDVMEYKMNIVTIHDMDWPTFNSYFRKRNGGTPLASIVKERARLDDPISQAILDISSNEYFRSNHFKSVFIKNQQQEIVAMNALLAAAGLKTESKAKKLADTLAAAQGLVLEHKDKAKQIVDFIVDAFKVIQSDIVKRAFTANYINAWIYLLVKHPEYTQDDIFNATTYIFAKSNAIPEYRFTVKSNASSTKSLDSRIQVIEDVVEQCRREEMESA